MKPVRLSCLFIFFLVVTSFTLLPKKKIRVWMIGDSTMAAKEARVYPETGWGTPFAVFFDSTVTVMNRAKNGRSTRTFIQGDLWQPVADSLQEGDYVFIQFGHNDEAKEERYKDRYTLVPDYKMNLVRFITEARNKKAIPVLITPVTRRKFDQQGKVMETHTEYSGAVAEVAAKHKVVMIDLDKKSRVILQQFGPEHSKLLFLQLQPGEHPNYPEGKNDNTHFSELGARKMAQAVLEDIRVQKMELADRIVRPNK
jgi:lysophospholipase L1-like esterase